MTVHNISNMYMYIYMYIDTYIHTYRHTYIHVYIYICMALFDDFDACALEVLQVLRNLPLPED